MKRRLFLRTVSALIAIALIFSCVVPVAALQGMLNFQKTQTYSGQFSDVDASSWYYGEVKNAYAYGLAGGVGDGKFSPASNVTVAEAIAFAVRINCIYYDFDVSQLKVSEAYPWYTGYVAYAKAYSLIGGEEFNGQYTRKATRVELAHILINALPASELTELNSLFSVVPDMKTSAQYYSNVLVLYKAGIITGSDVYGNFKPKTTITRAETIAIVNRLVDATQRKSFIPWVGNVNLNQYNFDLAPGDTFQLTAKSANGANNGGTVLWNTSDAQIATVSGDGMVTAVAEGTARVWTSEISGTKNSRDCVVTVTKKKTVESVDIFETDSPAVFLIEAYNTAKKTKTYGSGFFVNSNGTAYTALHLIDGKNSIVVTTASGYQYDDVSVIGYDILNDIAVLKINGNTRFPTISIGDSDKVQVGETIYCIGNPQGLINTISDGIISAINRKIYTDTFKDAVFMQFTAAVAQGSGGGVVVDEYGEAVAIAAGIVSTDTVSTGGNLNFAKPINLVKNIKLFAPISAEEFFMNTYGCQPGFGNENVQNARANSNNQNAMAMKSGQTVTAYLKNYLSKDYYSYKVGTAGEMLFLLEQMGDEKMPDFAISLLDDSGNTIGTSWKYDNGIFEADFYLPAPGTYKICITCIDGDTQDINMGYCLYGWFLKQP